MKLKIVTARRMWWNETMAEWKGLSVFNWGLIFATLIIWRRGESNFIPCPPRSLFGTGKYWRLSRIEHVSATTHKADCAAAEIKWTDSISGIAWLCSFVSIGGYLQEACGGFRAELSWNIDKDSSGLSGSILVPVMQGDQSTDWALKPLICHMQVAKTSDNGVPGRPNTLVCIPKRATLFARSTLCWSLRLDVWTSLQEV